MEVVACVVERDARILVCQRPSAKRHGGLWEFPGGKIEAGESLEAAAARELDEELGLTVRHVSAPIFASAQDAGIHIRFVLVVADGDVQQREHAATAWLPPAEILALPLAPTDRLFAESDVWRRRITDEA